MKSYGCIMERATTWEALNESIDYVLRGNERKRRASGRWILEHREQFIRELQEQLRSGSWRVGRFSEHKVVERGKERRIQCIRLQDRVAVNAVMKEVQRKVLPGLITDTASSIEGRGALWLHKRVRKAMKENPKMKWFYKCDVRKFYESIPQDKLLSLIDRKFREQSVRASLHECATMTEKGISIGLRTSQELGNLYLSEAVDHKLKDEMGCKWYWRYCDDMVVGAETAEELTPFIKAIHEGIESAGLEVKPTEQVFHIGKRPLDFLGYVIYENGRVAVRKSTKRRFARRWGRRLSMKRRTELAGSFYGLAKHADARHLFETITGWNMVDFAELGIKYVAEDGKKRFECPSVRLGDIQNTVVVVKDFETDVTTKEGGGRYVVLIDDAEGREKKFFTNSDELKQILDKVRDADKLPFRTTIKRVVFGDGKHKYCFT